MSCASWDVEGLPDMAAQGLTLSEIADEVGTTYGSVKSAARRRNISVLHERSKDHRAAIQDMSKLDAIEYLLGCIDALQEISPEKSGIPERIGLTGKEARVFNALLANPLGVMSKEALFNAAYFDVVSADDYPGIKIIDVFICKIRAKLPAEIGAIKTHFGRGYEFVPANRPTSSDLREVTP